MQINVLEYLDNIVKMYPDKLAYSDGGHGLTFKQTYDAARAVGTFLCLNGYHREPIAVCMKKSPETVAAFFGVVYGGCSYLPFDDEIPKHRIGMIFESVKPRAVICDGFMREYLKDLPYQCTLYDFDEISRAPADEAVLGMVRDKAIDTDPIYTVFTSGSTGAPKGVTACHRSVLDYIENLSETLRFSHDTVFGNQAPFYADACLKELYPTVKIGATTYIIPKQKFMFPLELIDYLNEHKVNTVCWVVSALTMISGFGALDKKAPEHLRLIAFGGEVFPTPQLNKWMAALPETRFVNLYGPTEATGMSCYYEVGGDLGPDEKLPIGRPFKNTEILLLNDDGGLAGDGCEGEICIRGTALTLGYWGDFEETDKSFVQNPLNSAYRELIYKTGDIGKHNESGELMFISRRDHQVKHMGHRIELGEIEAVASKLEGVKSACCVFDETHKKLVLYYTGRRTPADVSAYLKETLPRYMTPNSILQIDEMPLNANGKIDRNALRERSV